MERYYKKPSDIRRALLALISARYPPGTTIFSGDRKNPVVPVILANEKKKSRMPTMIAMLYGPPT